MSVYSPDAAFAANGVSKTEWQWQHRTPEADRGTFMLFFPFFSTDVRRTNLFRDDFKEYLKRNKCDWMGGNSAGTLEVYWAQVANTCYLVIIIIVIVGNKLRWHKEKNAWEGHWVPNWFICCYAKEKKTEKREEERKEKKTMMDSTEIVWTTQWATRICDNGHVPTLSAFGGVLDIIYNEFICVSVLYLTPISHLSSFDCSCNLTFPSEYLARTPMQTFIQCQVI